MQRSTSSLAPILLVVAAMVLVMGAFALAEEPQQLPAVGTDVVLRKTYNTSRFVYVEFGNRLVVYEHDDSRLFPVPVDVPVRITELSDDGDELEIKYRHAQLGEGSIKASFEGMGVGEAQAAATVVVGHAFALPGSADAYRPIIANTDTRVAHFSGSNHLPHRDHRVPFGSLEAARQEGYRPCRVCFFQTPRISNHQLEMELGRSCSAEVRFYSPLATDPPRQARLETIADRVLGQWPMPLRGYSYRFWLLESAAVNAAACPGGDVFVNTGLLDVIEDDSELEAILAHEIAHVELRHAYRRLRAAQKASFWTGLAAVAAGATTAAVTGDSYDAASVAELTTSLSALTSQIVLSGYGRDLEMESDSLTITYQQTNEIGAATGTGLAQVLRKLRYSGEVRGYDMDSGQSAFSSHPHIADRIVRADTAEARSMVGTTFVGYDEDGTEVAIVDFLLQSVSRTREGGGLEVLAAIETTPALGDTSEIDDLRVTVGGRELELDNREDTEIWPSDSVGFMLQNDDQHALLGELTALELDLRNVELWRREDRDRSAARPTSVRARVATTEPIVADPPPPAESNARPAAGRGGAAGVAAEGVDPSGLMLPILANKGVQWTERDETGVGYLWGAEVENPNGVPITTIVTLQFLDDAGSIVYEDEYEIVIEGGSKAAFTDEASMPEELATRGTTWAFEIALGEGRFRRP